MAWFDLQIWEEWREHQWCEAPLHQRGALFETGAVPAKYLLILHMPSQGFDNYFQAMCETCMDGIAADYGMTAESGKREPPS